MKIHFEILIELEIENLYFQNGVMPSAKLLPTKDCEQVLLNYGLLFKATSTGGVILYEVDNSRSEEFVLKKIAIGTKFTFEILNSDPYLYAYSDLPIAHARPDLFYFNNLNEQIVDSKLLLTQNPFVSESDQTKLLKTFEGYRVEASTEKILFEVKDVFGDVQVSKNVYKSNDDLFIYTSKDSALPQGFYSIYVDGVLYDTCYLASNLSSRNRFGVVEVFHHGSIPSTYEFLTDSEEVKSKKYSIRINRRAVKWTYYIIHKNLGSSPSLSMDYGSVTGLEVYPTSVVFNSSTPSDSDKKKLGDEIMKFVSNKELPLYEVPKTGIKVIQTKDSGSKNLLENSPNASYENLVLEGSKLKSEIFIQL